MKKSIPLFFIAGSLSLAGCDLKTVSANEGTKAASANEAPHPHKWEYTIRDGRFDLLDLNKMGEEKWELVAVVKDGSTTAFYFKRPKLN